MKLRDGNAHVGDDIRAGRTVVCNVSRGMIGALRRRYAWFGKLEACLLPPPEVRARFLE